MRVGLILRAHPRDEGACLVSGAVKNPFRLLRSLRDVADVVGVVAVDQAGSFDTEGYWVRGTRVRGLRLYARTLVWNLWSLPAVLRLFRSADVVQCHHPHFGLGAAALRRLFFRRTRFVVKAHGTAVPERAANPYSGLRGRLLSINAALHLRHDRLVLRAADRCLVSSDHQRREMVALYGVPEDRLVRVYNGVDPAHLRVRDPAGRDPAAAPRLVVVGRVVPKKGFERVTAIYQGVLARIPAATLTLVLGERSAIEDPKTYRLIEDQLAPLPGCAVLHDLDEDGLYRVLSASDLGLVPSQGYESIPTVVIEMLAAGLPVFATREWGIPEVLPERFGLAGDERDVDTIATFVQDELGSWDSAAHASAHEGFRYDRLAEEYVALYEELVHDVRR